MESSFIIINNPQSLCQDYCIVIITRFTSQVIAIQNLLAQMGLLDNYDIRVTTTTTALLRLLVLKVT